ncbi:MAG TPA: hypothetical protein VHU88_22370 [Sporichthyaceae bacterium]|jgi:hypothetical protein|nr:hypothetical protein [Sporichthyaceae bacterium]
MRLSSPAALLLVLAGIGGCGAGGSSNTAAPAGQVVGPIEVHPSPAPTLGGRPAPAGQADRVAIARVVDQILAAKDPATACRNLMTPGFVAATFGNAATCVQAGQDQGATDRPSGGTVAALTVSGDFATATVTDRGGNTAGARGTWKFVRWGGNWQLNEQGADYLRAQNSLALGKNHQASGADNPFSNDQLRTCVPAETQALPDPEYRAFAQGMTSGQSTIGKYFADCEHRTGVPSPFRPGQLAAIRTTNEGKQLPDSLTNCMVAKFNSEILEADLVNALFDGAGSPSFTRLQMKIAGFGNACASQLGMGTAPPTPAATPHHSPP